MGKGKDFGDALAEEVLMEVASGFLGERKEIEDQIALLNDYIAELAQKAEQVKKNAALVNYLFLGKDFSSQFYISLGVDPQAFSEIPGRPFIDIRFRKIPFAFGLKKRYSRLAVMAYDHLHLILTAYLTGPEKLIDFNEKADILATAPNYRMVRIMEDLINEKIKKINYGKSPASVLRFAKSLNPQLLEKEKITGAVSPDYEFSLDKALGLEPIDAACRHIKNFPELPDTQTARPTIVKTCEKLYSGHKPEIRRRVLELKENILSTKK